MLRQRQDPSLWLAFANCPTNAALFFFFFFLPAQSLIVQQSEDPGEFPRWRLRGWHSVRSPPGQKFSKDCGNHYRLSLGCWTSHSMSTLFFFLTSRILGILEAANLQLKILHFPRGLAWSRSVTCKVKSPGNFWESFAFTLPFCLSLVFRFCEG